MPRLSTLRTRALADLTRQLRFASREAALRQMERAEGLALELLEEEARARDDGAKEAPAAAYPQEWVVFRITGLRADSPMTEGQADMVVRAALLSDLGPLVERLSSAAAVQREGLRGEWLTVEDLMARWRMSRTTLERHRRTGLVGRRIALGRGKERLLFSERVVRVFERARGLGATTAARLTRMTAEERAALIDAARALRAEHGWTLDRCARELATRQERAKETIRRILRRHDDRAAAPIFDERPPLAEHERTIAEHAVARGAMITRTAARLGRTRATVYRVVKGSRVERLRGLDLSGPVVPGIDRAEMVTRLLASAAACMNLGGPSWADAERLIAEAQTIGPVAADEERARGAAYALLRARAARAIAALPKRGGKAARGGDLDAIETDLLWASRLKAEMVRRQLPPMVRAVETQISGEGGRTLAGMNAAQRAELFGVALAAVMESADRFDPFKGGRLAAPVAVAIGRAVSAWVKVNPEAGSLLVMEGAATPGRAVARASSRSAAANAVGDDWTRRVNSWQAWLDLERPLIEKLNTAGVSEEDRAVIVLRFGLAGGPPQTPAAIAAARGVPVARVNAALRRALARLRGVRGVRG